jgi:hypothetical protein
VSPTDFLTTAHVMALAHAIFVAIGRRVNDPDLVHLTQQDVLELPPDSVEAEVPKVEEDAPPGLTTPRQLASKSLPRKQPRPVTRTCRPWLSLHRVPPRRYRAATDPRSSRWHDRGPSCSTPHRGITRAAASAGADCSARQCTMRPLFPPFGQPRVVFGVGNYEAAGHHFRPRHSLPCFARRCQRQHRRPHGQALPASPGIANPCQQPWTGLANRH